MSPAELLELGAAIALTVAFLVGMRWWSQRDRDRDDAELLRLTTMGDADLQLLRTRIEYDLGVTRSQSARNRLAARLNQVDQALAVRTKIRG